MHDEDEKLSDGNYRFRCKFNGMDDMHNMYIEHPTERLHPIRNFCSHLLYNAHPSIKPIVTENKYEFDCGNYYVTRVDHLNPEDKSSPCSDEQFETKADGAKITRSMLYRCYNINSPISDVSKYMPCSGNRFNRFGSLMQSIDFTYTFDEHAPIKLPFYNENPVNDGPILERTWDKFDTQ